MPTAAKKPVYVAVIKMDDTYAVVLTRDGTAVEGFSTEAEGLAYFENAYRRAHVRSIEASTAAMISWLMMAPAIVEVADATVIQRWVGSARATVVAYRHESGNFTGIPIPAEVGAAVWKRGARPNLVPKPT